MAEIEIPNVAENLDLRPSDSLGVGRSQLARISNTSDVAIAPKERAFASVENQIFSHVGYHPIFIRSIQQKDRHRFTIEWSDGKISGYRLCDLQRVCACAQCRDETTGRMLIDPTSIPENLEALRIVSVGRYALQIYFSTGCSKGIYPFKLLRGLRLTVGEKL
jgi:DUF971 family protein